MPVHSPGLDPGDAREERRALVAASHTALIYGIGQIALGALVAVLAYETAKVAPIGEEQSKPLLGILIAFALYAVYRGVRQLRDGLALRRLLRHRAGARRDTP